MPLVEDPNPNAPRQHVLGLIIEVPVYGKPTDDLKTAQAIKAMLQTGVHSRVVVSMMNEEGVMVEVENRKWRAIA
jgi:hypothetical protein